jgi:hypothetical protein
MTKTDYVLIVVIITIVLVLDMIREHTLLNCY